MENIFPVMKGITEKIIMDMKAELELDSEGKISKQIDIKKYLWKLINQYLSHSIYDGEEPYSGNVRASEIGLDIFSQWYKFMISNVNFFTYGIFADGPFDKIGQLICKRKRR